MTFREMHNTHKVMATAAIFGLMVVEIHDITQSDRQRQKEFETTVSGLRATIDNTTPKASFAEDTMGFTALSTWRAGPIPMNLNYKNLGNATARGVYMLLRVYVGKLDDQATQETIFADFNLRWKAGTNVKGPSEANPAQPMVSTFTVDQLTEREARSIGGGSNTFYVLSRISWIDNTGRWSSDWCDGYQDPLSALPPFRNPTAMVLAHPCKVANAKQYREIDLVNR